MLNTFLDAGKLLSHSFVLYGDINDDFVTADLAVCNFDQLLVRTLKERGYKHIVFYGEAGTKGMYCLDPESARFFFRTENKRQHQIPTTGGTAIPQESSNGEKPASSEGSSIGAGGYQCARDLFRKNSKYPKQTVPSKKESKENPEYEMETPETVVYALRNMEFWAFHTRIQRLMLEHDSDMAIVFYNIFTSNIRDVTTFQDEVRDIWQKDRDPDGVPNICLFVAPETSETTDELISTLEATNLGDMFLLRSIDPLSSNVQITLNPTTCFQVPSTPGRDEVCNILRRLRIYGTDTKRKKILYNYSEIYTLADEILFACRRLEKKVMRTIIYRLFDYIDNCKESPVLFTSDTIGKIWGCQKRKDHSTSKVENSERKKPEMTVQRLSVEKEDVERPNFDMLMQKLDSLVGLDTIKKEVKNMINMVKTRKQRTENDLPNLPISLHMVFRGNPGTGKTSVARLISGLYAAIGILSKGQLVEVGRDQLVSGYIGQTALKTQAKIKEALGGVLLIDEAYSLSSGGENDFGREAIETLLKAMEDARNDLVVIVTGYPDKMKSFISSNPGLESRFNRYFDFPDYSVEELLQIFQIMCNEKKYILTPEAEIAVKRIISKRYEKKDENFGNARVIRNLFEDMVVRHSSRVANLANASKEDLVVVFAEDLEE